MAKTLNDIGIRHISDLKDRDPHQLYEDLCTLRKKRIDRCVLYVFRCAVYYASNESHESELLKWWSWKDDPECQNEILAEPKAREQSVRLECQNEILAEPKARGQSVRPPTGAPK